MSDDNTPDKDATEQPEGEPKDGEAKQPAAPRPRRTTAGRTTAPRAAGTRTPARPERAEPARALLRPPSRRRRKPLRRPRDRSRRSCSAALEPLPRAAAPRPSRGWAACARRWRRPPARRRPRRSAAAACAPLPEDVQPKRDALGRSYATGKRKNAVARVWIKPGNGKIEVNGRDSPVYFARPVLRMLINQPFVVTDRLGQFDVWCTVKGGGLSGQAGAVRHGISQALTFYEPGLRPVLKHGGFLTRDSRVVERKKYGKAKARRSFQFSKR